VNMSTRYLMGVIAAAVVTTRFVLPVDARAKKAKAARRRAGATGAIARRPHNGADAYLRLRFASIRQARGALRTLLPLTGRARR
jgi:hypothetical protein